MNLEFSRQIFEKIHKHQISWKSVQWEPSCSMRTDRHDEGNSRFLQFCDRPLKHRRSPQPHLRTQCLNMMFTAPTPTLTPHLPNWQLYLLPHFITCWSFDIGYWTRGLCCAVVTGTELPSFWCIAVPSAWRLMCFEPSRKSSTFHSEDW
jgi:hypothetical protein